jgi:type IV secretion system protein VirB9
MRFTLKFLACIGALLSFLPTLCSANQQPRSLAIDQRMKVVRYHPQDVVTLIGHPLIETQIQLNSTEQILDIEIGDPLAWAVSFKKMIPHLFFIKPKLMESDTNMTVITDQRNYHFNIRTSPKSSASATYALMFDYPEERRFMPHSAPLSIQNADFYYRHLNYTFRGSKSIAPIQAGDNGTFTVFKFAKHTEIPAIFAVDPHEHESLVNFHVQDDALWIQSVYAKYRFRHGEEIATVYNEQFSLIPSHF